MESGFDEGPVVESSCAVATKLGICMHNTHKYIYTRLCILA